MGHGLDGLDGWNTDCSNYTDQVSAGSESILRQSQRRMAECMIFCPIHYKDHSVLRSWRLVGIMMRWT
jgi:hypothetical protein